MSKCKKIIVCDGFKVMDETGPKWKSGRVCSNHIAPYSAFIDRLKARAAVGDGQWNNTEILPLPDRHGFGHAVMAGVERTTTDFVLVVQHDRRFNRKVSLEDLVHDMDYNHGAWVDWACDQLGDKVRPEAEAGPGVITRSSLMSGVSCPEALFYPRHRLDKLHYDPPTHTRLVDVDAARDELLARQPQRDDAGATLSGGQLGGFAVSSLPEYEKNSLLYTPSDVATRALQQRAPCQHQHHTDPVVPSAHDPAAATLPPTSRVVNPALLHRAVDYSRQVDAGGDPVALSRSLRYTPEYPMPLPVHCVSLTTPYTHMYVTRTICRFPVHGNTGVLPCPHAYSRLLDRVMAEDAATGLNKGRDYFYCESCPASGPDDLHVNLAKEPPAVGPRLVPMLYFFDSTHLARTDFYRTVLFNRWRQGKLELVRVGEFIEDKVIQMATQLLTRGMEQERQARAAMKKDDAEEKQCDGEPEDAPAPAPEAEAEADTEAAGEAFVAPSSPDPKAFNIVTRDDATNTISTTNTRSGKVWTRPVSGDPWRDFTCPSQNKDLKVLADSVAEAGAVGTTYGAHHVLQQEFGLWLLEDLNGAGYTFQGNFTEPLWLSRNKARYVAELAAAEAALQATEDGDEAAKAAAEASRAALSAHYTPDGRLDLVHGPPGHTASADYVCPPRGFGFVAEGRPVIGHLDGKAYWTDDQRVSQGFALKTAMRARNKADAAGKKD
jgi:hypothetical protein